jgi:hypothetical protein
VREAPDPPRHEPAQRQTELMTADRG